LTLGLTTGAARQRLAELGRNEIVRDEPSSPWRMFAAQFRSPLIWLLLGAALASRLLGEASDAVAIVVIVVINALVGLFQEYRSQRAMTALRAMTAPRARVIRDGLAVVIETTEVVPDDILVLEAGDIVAADASVIEAHALSTNEAALTGESLPVDKDTLPVPSESTLTQRSDTVFMGTTVAAGSGRARVVATGMGTALGHIATLIETAEQRQTPLQHRLERLSRSLLILCLSIVTIVAIAGLLHGQAPLAVLMSAVSLAVAAVPEGLPAVVTIALAIGVQRMAARNVLVRKLPSVETLGCATVICTDKTGTLTTGTMSVREIWGEDHRAVIQAAAACCDAERGSNGASRSGDPTEIAILDAAAERGIFKEQIELSDPRVSVTPFDARRRRMSILRANGVLYAKGAIEAIAELSPGSLGAGAAAAREMAQRGLRVLAVAVGSGPETDHPQLRFLGLIGIADPPRSEAIDAVRAAKQAGIGTVMITGDHPATALAVGRELGLVAAGQDASDVIHARATPEQKLEIVRRWKSRGAIVAMTGDGVNDAPALREADIGIAMGKSGTEVAREASDMILADDNFASIVAAVREGRGIFENIRKSVLYLMAGNVGEMAVMLGAAIVGLPLPLLPLQILWVNLVTDGLPALALVMEPTDRDILRRPPRRPEEAMLGPSEWRLIVVIGLIHGAVALGTFVWARGAYGLAEARSMTFSTLVFGQIYSSLGFRNRLKVLWEIGPMTNLRLVAVVAVSASLQLALQRIPAARDLFHLTSPSIGNQLIPLLAGLTPISFLELAKLIPRWANHGARAA
jgi:Ca2+-transporting ATPase